MNISARLALQVPHGVSGAGPHHGVSHGCDYHGRNVIVSHIDRSGFEARSSHDFPLGSLVRLRLPGAGFAVARVTLAEAGTIRADFLNPVGEARLSMIMGARSGQLSALA